jgi:hypothetical protein
LVYRNSEIEAEYQAREEKAAVPVGSAGVFICGIMPRKCVWSEVSNKLCEEEQPAPAYKTSISGRKGTNTI